MADETTLVLVVEMLVEVVLVVEATTAELAELVLDGGSRDDAAALDMSSQLSLGEERLLVHKGRMMLEAHRAEGEEVLLL